MTTLRIISRKSLLAKIQARLVSDKIQEEFDNVDIEFISKETSGDLDLSTPLHQMPDSGVFTNDIREELLDNKADLAVHSWKDLPIELEVGTEIAATLKREDPRDFMIFKQNSIGKENIKIYTSSPRRKENLRKFLPFALPWEPSKIDFVDVRGNIQTRISKFFESERDGLVIALAAMKRLLSSNRFLEEESNILESLRNCKWMVLPLSENPAAPAQGALAIEIASSNKKLKNLLQKIGHKRTYAQVSKEREILKKYGGGCHQKIGVSVVNSNKGEILSLKGLTEEGKKISELSFEPIPLYRNNLKEVKSFFPSNTSSSKIFDRVSISGAQQKVSKIKNAGIYISRGNVLENINSISETNLVWTSGVETWRKLANKGIWVNGTSDSMGEGDSPPFGLFEKVKWYKLSHLDAKQDKIKLIPTYELIYKELPDNLEKNTHFFWMSASAFKYVFSEFPSIKNANHSCGMGKTFDEINQIIPGKVYPYLKYQDWLEKIKKAK